MAEPHIANVIKIAKVSKAIEFHEIFETVSLISSAMFTFWAGGGWIRSLVEKNVTPNKMKAIEA